MIDQYYDYLIVGSGLSGLYSALLASRFGTVALITKTTIEMSNSYWAQGGIAAALDSSDDPEFHFKDTIQAGRGFCNKEAVKILVNEGRDRIADLINMGMKFDRSGGNYSLGMEGGHSKRRILHAGGSSTGKEIIDFLIQRVIEIPEIQIFENTTALRLISDGVACYGAYLLSFASGETYHVNSSYTFIATGGASGIYSRTTNPLTSTGDGIVLCYDAGAELTDMEFIQFHPTSFYSASGETFLISEAVRGEGGHLQNVDGKRFMKEVDEKAELAPRDIVSKAIFQEIKRTDSPFVYLNLTHLDAGFIKKRFSNIYEEAIKFGLDITKDLIPVSPAAHYMMGGVRSNLDSETTVSRLYAIGETASNGVHGANRLASNSLLECLVFGHRAAERSKEMHKIRTTETEELNFSIKSQNKEIYSETKRKISSEMTLNVGIVREGSMLERAADKFSEFEGKLDKNSLDYYQIKLQSLVTICRLITKSARIRKESRGGHIRLDFPVENDDYLFHIIHQKNSDIIKKSTED